MVNYKVHVYKPEIQMTSNGGTDKCKLIYELVKRIFCLNDPVVICLKVYV